VRCNRFVARDEQAKCSQAGHDEQEVSGVIELDAEGAIPAELPRFNWAAALMPPVWGPLHGAVSGIILLPVMIFALNAVQAAMSLPEEVTLPFRIIVWVVAVAIIIATLAFMYHYGTRGWGIAWNKSKLVRQEVVTSEMISAFVRRELLWTVPSVLSLAGFLYLVISFW